MLPENIPSEWRNYHFGITYSVTLGRGDLATTLAIRNTGGKEFEFQTLFHSYFAIDVSLSGLDLPIRSTQLTSTGHLQGGRLRSRKSGLHRQSRPTRTSERQPLLQTNHLHLRNGPRLQLPRRPARHRPGKRQAPTANPPRRAGRSGGLEPVGQEGGRHGGLRTRGRVEEDGLRGGRQRGSVEHAGSGRYVGRGAANQGAINERNSVGRGSYEVTMNMGREKKKWVFTIVAHERKNGRTNKSTTMMKEWPGETPVKYNLRPDP